MTSQYIFALQLHKVKISDTGINDTGKVMTSFDANNIWLHIKLDIEFKEIPCKSYKFNPKITYPCKICQLKGHNTKNCIHDSQFLAYFLSDWIKNKNVAKPIKLKDHISPNTIIVLRRVPFSKALQIYDLQEVYKYAEYREQKLRLRSSSKTVIDNTLYNTTENIKNECVKHNRIYGSKLREQEREVLCFAHQTKRKHNDHIYICHTCGLSGHLRQDCPKNSNQSSVSSIRHKEYVCHTCGIPGHLRKDCSSHTHNKKRKFDV